MSPGLFPHPIEVPLLIRRLDMRWPKGFEVSDHGENLEIGHAVAPAYHSGSLQGRSVPDDAHMIRWRMMPGMTRTIERRRQMDAVGIHPSQRRCRILSHRLLAVTRATVLLEQPATKSEDFRITRHHRRLWRRRAGMQRQQNHRRQQRSHEPADWSYSHANTLTDDGLPWPAHHRMGAQAMTAPLRLGFILELLGNP